MIFGGILHLHAGSGTEVFIAMLIILVLFELLLKALEEITHEYKGLMDKLIREFMIMGVISFISYFVIEAYNFSENEYFLAFHFSHLIVFFIALGFILQAVFLVAVFSFRHKQLVKYGSISSEKLLHDFKAMAPSVDGQLSWYAYLFHYGPVCLDYPNLRANIEYKIIEAFFIRIYSLPLNFNYSIYLFRTLKKFMISLVEVRPINWLILGVLVVGNYARIVALANDKFYGRCDYYAYVYHPHSSNHTTSAIYDHSDDHSSAVKPDGGSYTGGNKADPEYEEFLATKRDCEEYLIGYVVLVLFGLLIYDLCVLFASEVYMRRLLRLVIKAEKDNYSVQTTINSAGPIHARKIIRRLSARMLETISSSTARRPTTPATEFHDSLVELPRHSYAICLEQINFYEKRFHEIRISQNIAEQNITHTSLFKNFNDFAQAASFRPADAETDLNSAISPESIHVSNTEAETPAAAVLSTAPEQEGGGYSTLPQHKNRKRSVGFAVNVEDNKVASTTGMEFLGSTSRGATEKAFSSGDHSLENGESRRRRNSVDEFMRRGSELAPAINSLNHVHDKEMKKKSKSMRGSLTAFASFYKQVPADAEGRAGDDSTTSSFRRRSFRSRRGSFGLQHRKSFHFFNEVDKEKVHSTGYWVFAVDCVYSFFEYIFVFLTEHESDTLFENTDNAWLNQTTNNFNNIFLWSSPVRYFHAIEIALLCQCVYLSFWATNFVIVANDLPNGYKWHIAMALPVLLKLIILAKVVYYGGLLRTVCNLDMEISEIVTEEANHHILVLEKFRSTCHIVLEALDFNGITDEAEIYQQKMVLVRSLFESVCASGDPTLVQQNSMNFSVFYTFVSTILRINISSKTSYDVFCGLDKDKDGLITWEDLSIILFPEMIATHVQRHVSQVKLSDDLENKHKRRLSTLVFNSQGHVVSKEIDRETEEKMFQEQQNQLLSLGRKGSVLEIKKFTKRMSEMLSPGSYGDLSPDRKVSDMEMGNPSVEPDYSEFGAVIRGPSVRDIDNNAPIPSAAPSPKPPTNLQPCSSPKSHGGFVRRKSFVPFQTPETMAHYDDNDDEEDDTGGTTNVDQRDMEESVGTSGPGQILRADSVRSVESPAEPLPVRVIQSKRPSILAKPSADSPDSRPRANSKSSLGAVFESIDV